LGPTKKPDLEADARAPRDIAKARLTVVESFDDLPKQHFAVILADPPWRFETYDKREVVNSTVRRRGDRRQAATHYRSMTTGDIRALPVKELAVDDCVLFLWITWPMLIDALSVIEPWGFEYKTCAFCWMKAHADQLELFRDDFDVQIGNGYWTRSNSEVCLLATRGRPKRLNADVRQAIIEPRREHSRKPDCVHERIERLVAGPYLELFARQRRQGWTSWGNEVDRFGVQRENGHETFSLGTDQGLFRA
jgi:N6-adenosine-specific RNA methylase IME4